ncbi:type I restriction endonuclease subunit R [Arthrobacter caoxuetaonis]|uniref:Type I restriction enzyme endonuclease subunit n=1 Tax=Arthrobacter caoxuetaonis TaxID=2886935 RepID=A0A9X1SB48_9MICC|nr:type I restriction endonuclease subunit R [Arthrobacter caoxuetaonis]MCC3296818.1 type I restriction endonuclease subunit R [Arthrobacter caoxuetaonis]USQ56364.1 type I restriction endonuclease subunit R [Arthrobacter caoxuetaonis]
MTQAQQLGYSEADWEGSALEMLAEPLGWLPKTGHEIAPGTGERDTWDELLIRPRLLKALHKFNPAVPTQYLKQALAEIASPKSADSITENKRIHDYLTDGFRLTYIDTDGTEVSPTLRLLSHDPDENDWLAVNQVTIVQGDYKRRFDLVLYCNGMPVSIIELKKAGSKNADVPAAHNQLATYVREFPMAFRFCVFTLASDGLSAKYGTPFTPLNHFSPWNVDDDGKPVTPGTLLDGEPVVGELDTALLGLYNQERFLQLLHSYTAFDEGAAGLTKRIAKPHQYFAVTKAVGSTVPAVGSNGKAGVVWHTQGSGKSMEMELYTNLVIRHPKLRNPTVVVITDRNELDGQLFESFLASQLLPEKAQQIRKRSELRTELSSRTTGGIYFTTLQKFGRSQSERDAGAEHPLLSDRRNIIVVVDEAHRSHYDNLDGYARHLRDALPHATLIAFTGTPISFDDRNTQDVFGEYIDVYDLSRAVADGATVPVYFEPRLIKVGLAEGVSEETLDAAADEATRTLDDTERARIEASVAVVNAVYGAPERIAKLAQDLVEHWENRSEKMEKFISAPGKAMIVGGTREICANLYSAIVALRPEWHSDELDKGKIKVVYSGTASDAPPVSDHVRRDAFNASIKERLKNVDDELELVIVKDMMLTGFDSPPLHTLYLDRPLKGALLMQTLARVNRTFRGKEGGLLVAYAPLAENLTKALAEYNLHDGGTQQPLGKNIDEAIAETEKLVAKLDQLLDGHDWRAILDKGGPKAWLHAAWGAVNYLRDPLTPGNKPEADGESLASQYRSLSSQLARAWALCSGTDYLPLLLRDVRMFEEIRVWMAKMDAADRQSRGEPIPEDISRLLGQLIATSTVSGEVLDIYEAAGMPKPSLDDLTPEFMAKTQKARNPQLAIEALRKLISEEAARTTRNNVIRERAFSERITELMNKYTNQQLTSAEVIAALVELAKEVAKEKDRGQRFSPPLNEDELAFYDAVTQNDSAVDVQGEGVLANIARDLVAVMRRDVRTDWTVRDDVRAKLRSSIKRLLVKNGYPPDKQPAAIKLVMEQMESMAPRFAEARAG